jgi:hypothetical protein
MERGQKVKDNPKKKHIKSGGASEEKQSLLKVGAHTGTQGGR